MRILTSAKAAAWTILIAPLFSMVATPAFAGAKDDPLLTKMMVDQFEVRQADNDNPLVLKGQGWIGLQGLAPYFFEVDAALFVGDSGHTTLRLEAEYELLLTQRLILTPEIDVNFYGKDDAATGVGSGLSDVELGLRLRYDFLWVSVVQALVVVVFQLGALFFIVEEVLLFVVLVFVKHRFPPPWQEDHSV